MFFFQLYQHLRFPAIFIGIDIVKNFVCFLDNRKNRRVSITKLLEERLEQKERHEEKRQKRHEDKMTIETKLIDALAQFLKK